VLADLRIDYGIRAGTLAEAQRRRGSESRIAHCESAYALRSSSVTGCEFLQIRAICGNRGICVANDASSQPAARKLACGDGGSD
jgi:hypothetical protein